MVRRWRGPVIGLLWLGMTPLASASESGGEAPAWWGLGVLPFVAILSAIAILPLLHWSHRWWESNLHRLQLSLGVSAATIAYYLLVARRGWSGVGEVLEHALLGEYLPFIVLLFSLYVISGGIHLAGDLRARPETNVAFLATGAVLASFIGTTGASMLLIRPLLETNRERGQRVHTVIFFIFLVSNVGGTLLPIGDPPLFLGYLKGVPFFWTLSLFVPWATTCALLLAIYYLWDLWIYHRVERPEAIAWDERELKPLRVDGGINALWLAGVVLAVAFVVPGMPFPFLGFRVFPFLREGLLLVFVALSLRTTPAGVRARNHFDYAAINEVAALFVGIFVAMQVPVEVLYVKGASLGLDQPWKFFWATGGLSSVLDNAPTYVVFFETANAMTHAPGPGILELLSGHYIRTDLLAGISLGAVFLGSMTYIGNGPNFMVKAIAEQARVPMPSFFGYILRFSVPILIPVFGLMCLLFLGGR